MAAVRHFLLSPPKMARMALVFFIILSASRTYASPHPAVGSSILVAPEHGLFWKRLGFQIKTGKSGWELASPQGDEDFLVRYLKPNSVTGSLAVRTEVLKTELTLENYTKRWMRDYTNYGFEVLGTSSFIQNGAKGLVVDLLHKKSDQQLRQVLFLKTKRVVVLTCRDQQKKFQQTLLGCNQISKTFEWAETNRPKAF